MNAPRHALVVEDLDFWQDALREVLADAGYRVWVAASYAQALAALAAHEFHLAVIDPVLNEVNRRNRDGLRVLQHILDERPGMVAVVVTSSDANRIRREVAAMSATVPLFWKDEWDDEKFLTIVKELVRNDA